MSIFSDWDNNIIMFKFSDNEPLRVPLYAELVDRSWTPTDLDKIVEYLRQCTVINSTTAFEPVVCPLCGEILERITCSQQSDGVWIWLKDLSHYVKCHNLRLPDKMVEHIRSNQYLSPFPK
jgi:hypothetical protein